MDTSALMVVLVGTLLFLGFAIWMAFYSRQREKTNNQNEAE